MAEGRLIITCVPSLFATLLDRERSKGAPLSEQEVLEIRDNAPAVAMPPEAVSAIEAGRGYKDLDPENVWAAWQKARLDLV